MIVLRKLLALAIAAVAVLAISASSASAQVILDEVSAEPCEDVEVTGHTVDGECHVHMVSEGPVTLFSHVGLQELPSANCSTEFDVYYNADGTGFVTNQMLFGPNCTFEACDEPAPSHALLEWPFSVLEAGPDEEDFELLFCLRSRLQEEGEIALACHVEIPLFQQEHTQELLSDGELCDGTTIEVFGHWVSEDLTGEQVIVVH